MGLRLKGSYPLAILLADDFLGDVAAVKPPGGRWKVGEGEASFVDAGMAGGLILAELELRSRAGSPVVTLGDSLSGQLRSSNALPVQAIIPVAGG